jgi:peroxiredoxin
MKFVTLLLVACSLSATAQTALGRRAPGFSLPDLNLKQHDLQDYRGKVVLFDFMRTDCPKCQALTQTLEEVKAKYGDKVQILSVVTAGADNLDTVRKYMTDNKLSNPFLFDCGQMTASYLNITPKNPQIHLPQLLVVDKNGQIRKEMNETSPGALTLQSITSAVDPLVK